MTIPKKKDEFLLCFFVLCLRLFFFYLEILVLRAFAMRKQNNQRGRTSGHESYKEHYFNNCHGGFFFQIVCWEAQQKPAMKHSLEVRENSIGRSDAGPMHRKGNMEPVCVHAKERGSSLLWSHRRIKPRFRL